ncbi:MAG: Bug family tripartite tricarboxylate transporter substrate binding protein [Burkholderiales bacterium]
MSRRQSAWNGRVLAFTLGIALALPCFAQTFPNKPIRIVVPFAAGGPTDTVSRALAQRLAEPLGQSVIVENRPGAATIIGAEAVAKAAPDGYTLLFTADATLAVNPLLYSKLPYSAADFTPVTIIAYTPEYLMVTPDVPANTLQEFIAYAKANAGKLNYGSFGMGTSPHIEAEGFKAATGINIVHVPFKGAAEVIPAMVSGQIQVVFTGATQALPHIRAGKIKVIAVQSRERTALLPNVPTFLEEGVPGFDSRVWFGMLAPAKTPPEIVRRLASEMGKVTASQEFRDKYINALSLEPSPPGPEYFATVIERDKEKYARFVKAANVKLD